MAALNTQPQVQGLVNLGPCVAVLAQAHEASLGGKSRGHSLGHLAFLSPSFLFVGQGGEAL